MIKHTSTVGTAWTVEQVFWIPDTNHIGLMARIIHKWAAGGIDALLTYGPQLISGSDKQPRRIHTPSTDNQLSSIWAWWCIFFR